MHVNRPGDTPKCDSLQCFKLDEKIRHKASEASAPRFASLLHDQKLLRPPTSALLGFEKRRQRNNALYVATRISFDDDAFEEVGLGEPVEVMRCEGKVLKILAPRMPDDVEVIIRWPMRDFLYNTKPDLDGEAEHRSGESGRLRGSRQ